MMAIVHSQSLNASSALRARFVTVFAICAAVATVLAIIHLGLGARAIAPRTVVDAFLAYDARNFEHSIIYRLRLARLLSAVLIGACLGMAGAVLQAVIRNPLGEPHILGLNAGAALAVVASTALGGSFFFGATGRPLMAAAGAAILFGCVLGISYAGRSGPTPLKVTLCGVALSAFASALTSTILILDDQSLADMRVWLAGDLAGSSFDLLRAAALPSVIGAVLAFIVAPRLNVIQLGDKVATGLGVNAKQTRLIALLAAASLCGSSVAVAGPVGFVGLVVPHAARKLLGNNDLRFLLPITAVAGACVVLTADILARFLLAPTEMATGVMTAAIGAPVFVLIVTRTFR